MDAMYRKKSRAAENEEELQREAPLNEKHAADDFNPKLRPRETHPDSVDADVRISKNLDRLNRRFVDAPSNSLVYEEKNVQEAESANEDRGAKVITRSVSISAPAPLALIFSCVITAVVFMYMLSLSVQIEEYSYSISQIETQIAVLKEEAGRLEVQLENKYDLAEVERIATQEYGMVASSSLPKKYVSITEDGDVWQETEQQEEKRPFFQNLFEKLFGIGE